MNHMERYLDRIIENDPVDDKAGEMEALAAPIRTEPAHEEEPSSPHILRGLLRRWYVVLGGFIVLAAVGIPAVYLLYEPGYVVTGYIQVAPAVKDPLTGQADRGDIGNYDNFIRTQSLIITSNAVLGKVADELADRNLSYFTTNPKSPFERLMQRFVKMDAPRDSLDVLKKAVNVGVISASPLRGTNVIAVSMKSMVPEESKIIVNSIMRNYMADYFFGTTQTQENNLSMLQDRAKVLKQKLERERSDRHTLAQEFGTTQLDSRQDMMVESIGELKKQLASLQAERINLEINVGLWSKGLGDVNAPSPDSQLAQKNTYINADSRVQQLVDQISQQERDVYMSERSMTTENPDLVEKKALLKRMKQELADQRKEVGQEFDQRMAGQANQAKKKQLEAAQARLKEVKAHEDRLQQIISSQDNDTRELGRINLEIQDLEAQLKWDQEMYENVRRRINELEMARKSLPRMTIQSNADNTGIEDRRVKLSLAVLFGALACGCFLAFLLDKADKRVRDPEELSNHLRLPMLGTIASSMGARPAKFAEQVASDYQTIRTNLGLIALEGIPRKLAVVSSTTREGKTTFSVNLATSLSRSGKRVLLIDGDLRKPDIVNVLDMGDSSRRSHKVVTEGGFEYTIYTVPTSGVDVLIPDVRRMHDVYELIASPMVAQRIEMMSQKYDHVIIDTPPILAFPDAIIWGRLAGCAVLVSFAGRSLSTDLEATKLRLAQAKIKILGTVMNNVQAGQAYHSYGYGYYYRNSRRSKKSSGSRSKKLLLPSDDDLSVSEKESPEKRAVVNQ